MSLFDKIPIPRRTMVLFFVVDTSGCMAGSKIGAVNTAIEEAIPAIKEVSDGNANAAIKIAALEFSSGAEWKTPEGPVPAEEYRWNYLQAGGLTDFGEACKALNEKLSTKAFMQEAAGSFAPVIFLLSDNYPTDDWQRALAALKQNNWFKASLKAAVAICDDANKDVLNEFTGNPEAVMEVHDLVMLKKMIKFVSVTASQVASKSSNVNEAAGDTGYEAKQEALIEALAEIKKEAAAAPDQDWWEEPNMSLSVFSDESDKEGW